MPRAIAFLDVEVRASIASNNAWKQPATRFA